MVKLPNKVKNAIKKADVFSLATSSKKGKPNLIYVGYLKLINDETILIADNYFDKTKKNMMKNPQMAVTVRDEKAGSYQIKGRVKYLTKGKYYDEVQEWCDKKHPRRGAVLLTAKEVYNGAKKIK